MKILYVSSARIPSERPHAYAIAKMCEAFACAGHEVVLISPRKTSEMGPDTHGYYDLARNFAHVRIRSLDLLVLGWWGGHIGFWIDFFSFVIGLLTHRNLLAHADVLYTREAYIALFLPRAKTVLELHTLPARTMVMRRLLRSVGKLSVISHGLADDVRAFSGRTDIIVLPDAVDMNRFSQLPGREMSRAALNLSATKHIALYAGNFYHWKGVDVLADAAKLIPDIQVVVVGGTDETDYRRVAARIGAGGDLVVRRVEPRERVPLYLAAADVLVIPNVKGTAISERHTSPLKLFEYMAAGKPIVASDIPALREIIDDGMAVFCEPGNPAGLAAAIRQALRPDIGLVRAAAAMARVRAYSWSERVKRAIQIL